MQVHIFAPRVAMPAAHAEKATPTMSPSDLTPRQQAVLDFVRECIAADGMPPTLAEIAREFGFRQARAAQKHLAALAAKGQLTLLPGKARGIRLPQATATARSKRDDVQGRTSVAGGRMPGATEPLALPLLGRVAAGLPIGADAEIEREVFVDPHLFRPRPDYLLRVRGDSMRDDGILDGDLIAVHRTPQARSGQTVVARVDGEITVKRLEYDLAGDKVRLLPRNPEHAPIEIDPRTDDFAIEGLYVGVLRGA
jgi:repressor LexA